MNLSRDLAILLILMFVGFLIGYWVAEATGRVDAESAAIIAAVSSSGGMVIGYVYLAFEKREKFTTSIPKRRKVFSPQIVGEKCTKCEKRVLFIGEAFFCADCGKPFHRRCGKSPRCENCDSRVAYANRAIISDWEFDAEKMDWVSTSSEKL